MADLFLTAGNISAPEHISHYPNNKLRAADPVIHGSAALFRYEEVPLLEPFNKFIQVMIRGEGCVYQSGLTSQRNTPFPSPICPQRQFINRPLLRHFLMVFY